MSAATSRLTVPGVMRYGGLSTNVAAADDSVADASSGSPLFTAPSLPVSR